ncbi:capsular polysaccharide synthesis protein [Sedimentimonas flavescens]|uniref:capsular polysaccharide synthesis protein n=1 Tax=Sedimentimonas flavescens TaxID=2851012 RepID=UPI0021A36C18|nr:capsular polysaccharide synthesis protein [Sedimentimonas flavescens]MCT2541234.1 capsular polysaccharide synthesis protein [Sedimentimonas flavescens]
MDKSATSPIPRNIWMLWLQGFEKAPPLVQTCVTSWRELNSDWNLHLLTQETLADYLEADFVEDLFSAQLPNSKIANIARLALINRHGGVWADADVYCVKPLDEWIDQAAASGFFAFRFEEADAWLKDESVPLINRCLARTDDRVMANWFLAGHPNNFIAGEYVSRHLAFLKLALSARKKSLGFLRNSVISLMKRNAFLASMMGSEAFVTRVGRYPYFIFHYHFANLLRHDYQFRVAWEKVEPRSARAALSFSKLLGRPVDAGFKAAIHGEGDSPVYKFHWRRTKALQQGTETRFGWLQEQAKSSGS